MFSDRDESRLINIYCFNGERTFEVVPQFTSFGSKVSNGNSMVAELRARMLPTSFLYSLKNQFT